jgi:dihydroflavonol-4-reductase
MKIFITGATGFIGKHLVERLAKTDHQVTCLVRDPNRARSLRELGARLVQGDVTDRTSVLEGMRGCDWVFNLANIYALWLPDKREYDRVNIDGTRNVMECALEMGVSKVIHLSTYGIWAGCRHIPFNEESPVGLYEVSDYVRTKLAGDRIAWDLYEKRGLPFVMICPGNVLGQGDNKPTGQFMSDMVNGKMPVIAFTDTIFTYVHVKDVVEAILKAAEKKGNLGERYIVANEERTIKEMMEMTAEISGVPAPRLVVPAPLAKLSAVLLTAVSRFTKRRPMMGLSVDQARTMASPLRADGSKARRELGIAYTPIRLALEEAIPEYMGRTASRTLYPARRLPHSEATADAKALASEKRGPVRS